jgi:membrane-bound lytic murein transglycosylase D
MPTLCFEKFSRLPTSLTRLCVLASALWLSGCVTTQPATNTQGPAPVISSQSPNGIPSRAEAPAATPQAQPTIDNAAVAAASQPQGAPQPPEVPLTPAPTMGPLTPIGTTAPLAAADVATVAAPSDMWDRIRRGLAMTDIDGPLVESRINWYVSKPDYIQRMSERSARYMFYIVEELERRHLPTELALLPFIESAFNPDAVSRTKAVGIWQFMPRTGREFDLRQNSLRDDRQDVVASTNAALDYLESLYAQFGDWHLALAAYNWGQGNVRRAIARNKKAGKPTGYLDLRMPNETRLYVPKLQAVEQIVRNPEAYGLTLPEVPNHPFFESVTIDRDIDVALVAKLSGISEKDFRNLNPAQRQPVILSNGTPEILLPWDNATEFKLRLEGYNGPLSSWTAWVAKRNYTPAQIAKLVQMPEKELRAINNIPPRMLVRKGSTLLVRKHKETQADVPAKIADNARLALAPQFSRQKIRVKRGQTLSHISDQYGVSVATLMKWNNLKSPRSLRAGQSLIVKIR